MTARPSFWLLAGVNGAGKSTFARIMSIGDAPCLDPDALARKLHDWLAAHWLARPRHIAELVTNYAAAVSVERDVARALSNRESVSVETALASRKYEPHVRRAKELGFATGLIYVALANVDLAIQRVAARVKSDGHDVAEAKIRKRWTVSLDNLGFYAPLVDELYVFDNSDTDPALVAEKAVGGVIKILDPMRLPEITRRLT